MKIELLVGRVIIEDGKKVSYTKGDIVEIDTVRANDYIKHSLGKIYKAKKSKEK